MLSKKGEELFYNHLYLVELYSNKFARYKWSKDERYQLGALGLMDAIKRCDASKGEFKNDAKKYIRGEKKKKI